MSPVNREGISMHIAIFVSSHNTVHALICFNPKTRTYMLVEEYQKIRMYNQENEDPFGDVSRIEDWKGKKPERFLFFFLFGGGGGF